jgi:DNA-directed RNA polymerase specialized sigma24 family protein
MSNHSAVENRTMSEEELTRAVEEAYPILFARLKCRYKDEQLADEVSRDCLSQAFEKWEQDREYFVAHDLTTWSSTRAIWRAVDRLRQRNRLAALPDEPFTDFPVATADLYCTSDTIDNRHAAWEALNQLNEMERRILIGHFYDGRSDQDLGTELFGEKGTLTGRGLRVWRLRQKAQARLRDLLLSSGFDPEEYAGQAV